MKIGKLQEVEIRDLWHHEQYDFSAWLVKDDNIALLNKLVFEYIEAFYNTVRIHSHCGYLSPDDFENLYNKSLAYDLRLVS